MSTFVMGQSFYGGAAETAVDYTNPYLMRNEYYRNPYGVYHPAAAVAADAERR